MKLRNRRRTVLKLLGMGIGGVAAGGVGLAQESTSEYVVMQDDRCEQVRPIQGDQPVEEFYDWEPTAEKNWSSNGTVDLQQEDTSIVFLYDGPEGLSIVFVHGMLESGSIQESQGGSASFRVRGLPGTGEWVVEDDNYDGPNNYDVWEHRETESRIDWTWAGSRTDGGVFRGLTDEAVLEIRPGFNDDADLHQEHYGGEVTSWQFLSGSRENPDRIELALDEEIVVQRGTCSGSVGGNDGGNDDDDDDPGRGPPEDDEGNDGDNGRGPPDDDDDDPGRGPPDDGEGEDDDGNNGRGPPDDEDGDDPGRGPPDD